MNYLFSIDWKGMFIPNVPILEIIIRGSIVYLSIFILLRVLLKRQSSEIGMTDLLVLVLLADAAQNAMAGAYTTITDGVVLVATIIVWSLILDWLGFINPKVERLINPPPVQMIKNGRLISRNLRRELMTMDELQSQLRTEGVEKIEDVKDAFIEPDGKFTVIKKEK